jgi:hypothetical protein
MWFQHSDHSDHSLCTRRARRGTPLLRVTFLLVCLAVCLAASLSACTGSTGTTPPITAIVVTPHPFAIILCQASDDTSTPANPLSFYKKMFTDPTPGLLNVYQYFADNSYGSISLAGTTVLDWTRVPTSTAVPTDTASLRKQGRTPLAQACADTAKGKIKKWADFTAGGIITIWNTSGLDSGATAPPKGGVTEDGTKYRAVNSGLNPALGGADPTTVSFYTHEMIHDLGANHAHGPYIQSPTGAPLINTMVDQGATHTFGSIPRYLEYGDCWSIMGCGEWVFADAPYGVAGPGLGVAQRDRLGWLPAERVVTYTRDSTMTVTLAPEDAPVISGKLLIKIPIGDKGEKGYYTVEYIQKTGWNRAIALDHAVLIHEVHADDPTVTWEVSRNIYGAWVPGQVFFDPMNRVRISIDHFGDALGTAATVTLSPGGAPDDGSSTCMPPGYRFRPDLPSSPVVLLDAPLNDAHAVAGYPVTLQAKVQQLVGTGDAITGAVPIPESQIRWTANGTALGTGSSLLHTFTTPGDYTIEVSAFNTYCLLNKKAVTLHVDASAPATPTVVIVQPVDKQVYEVNPPSFLQSVSFVGSGSSDIDSYVWVDSLDGFLGSGQDLTANLHLHATGNCAHEDHTITLRGTTKGGTLATASITVTLKSTNCIR